ncbi:hypothetical protein BJ742DRAFT_822415 [Cladochytrium replicatum]|nr:hypothetical protein BJ742DRAFT_822415 [Cladochytrium replicatum]
MMEEGENTRKHSCAQRVQSTGYFFLEYHPRRAEKKQRTEFFYFYSFLDAAFITHYCIARDFHWGWGWRKCIFSQHTHTRNQFSHSFSFDVLETVIVVVFSFLSVTHTQACMSFLFNFELCV